MLWSSSSYFLPCCPVKICSGAHPICFWPCCLVQITNMLWSSSNNFWPCCPVQICSGAHPIISSKTSIIRHVALVGTCTDFLSSICVTPTAPMYLWITFFSFQASCVMKFSSDILNSSLPFLSSPFCPVILSFLMKFSYSSCYYSFHYVILPIIMECSFSYCNSSFQISSPFNPVTFPSNFPWTYVFLPGLLSSSLDFSHPPGLVSSSLD